MPGGQQDEAGAVEPAPRRSAVAAEQVGGRPAERECFSRPATFDQPRSIALHPRPALRRYSLCSVGREDGVDTVVDLARQAADALHDRCNIVGRLRRRQQRYDLGLVLVQARAQLVREGLGRPQSERFAFQPDRAAGLHTSRSRLLASAVISVPPSRRWTLVGLRSEAHLEAHLLKPADFLGWVGLVGLGGLFRSLLRARVRAHA